MGMARLTLGILGALAIGGAITLYLQRQTEAELQAAATDLRRQNRAIGPLREEHARLVALQIPADEMAALRTDHDELPRLRNELEGLKNRPPPPAKVQAANDTPAPPAPKPLALGMTPAAVLQNVGTATLDAAAQTFFWAVAQSDSVAVANMLTFDESTRAKADALFASLDETARKSAGSPEELAAFYLVAMYQRFTGVQFFNQQMDGLSGGWTARAQMPSGGTRDLGFKTRLSADGWRELVPAQLVDLIARDLGKSK
jgi:hypothetical protein